MDLIKLKKRIEADQKRLNTMGIYYQKQYQAELAEVHTSSEEAVGIVVRLGTLVQALGVTHMTATCVIAKEAFNEK